MNSVYWKSQSIRGSKSFSSRRLFEHRVFEIPKQVTWITPILTICQDRLFTSFLCVLSLSSVLGRLIRYCDTGIYGCWNVAKRIFMWYQNIFLFSQNKFIFNKVNFYDIKIYFHFIKINFYSIKYIFMISKYIFIQSKYISIQ